MKATGSGMTNGKKKGNVGVNMRLISENLVMLKLGTQLTLVTSCLSCGGMQLITESRLRLLGNSVTFPF